MKCGARALFPVVALSTATLAWPHHVRAAEPPARDSGADEARAVQVRAGQTWAKVGTGAIAVGVFGYVGMGIGLVIRNEAQAQVASTPSEANARTDRMDLGRNLAWGMGISAMALVGGGITLVVLGRRKIREAERKEPRTVAWRAAPVVLPGGGGGALSLRF